MTATDLNNTDTWYCADGPAYTEVTVGDDGNGRVVLRVGERDLVMDEQQVGGLCLALLRRATVGVRDADYRLKAARDLLRGFDERQECF